MRVLTSMAPLPPSIWRRRPPPHLPFPLEAPRCRLLARGRHALWDGVRAAGLRAGDEVLVPAYHHGSEIQALVRAGLCCRFYEATPTLAPDEHEIERLRGPQTRALHLVHYLGFAQDARRWRQWCDERGLLLIEDAAQAWLSSADGTPVGSAGDVAIFCLYKTFGLPDGAALLLGRGVPAVGRGGALGLSALGREHLLWLAARSSALGALMQRLHPCRRRVSPHDMALGSPRRPTATTLLALARVADDGAARTRRRNYEWLLARLPELVAPPFAPLPSGASPFVFPIASDDKRQLLARLDARGIRALDLWSIPHPSLPVGAFPAAARLRAKIVGLPVHQELTSEDLERMVEEVRVAVAA